MCCITYIHKVKEKPISDNIYIRLTEYFEDQRMYNTEGAGVWQRSEQKVTKYPKSEYDSSLYFAKLIKDMPENDDIIVHHRLATQGSVIFKNTQPIETSNYVIIHNGHLHKKYEKKIEWTPQKLKELGVKISKEGEESYNALLDQGEDFYNDLLDDKEAYYDYRYYGIDDKSDTLEFAEILQQKKNIYTTLKKHNGFYSMFIYSKKTNKLYYTKNNQTSFQFMYYPEFGIIVGSTRMLDLEKVFNHMEGKFYQPVIKSRFMPEASEIIDMDALTSFQEDILVIK